MPRCGCVSFFCTHLFCSTDGGRRTSEKGFAPGVARARTSNGMLFEGLSRRSGGSSNRGMRQPIHPRSPDDEEPTGTVQPLLAICLPPLGAQRLLLSHRRRPRLVPPPIAHCVAEHEHGIDVLSTEAAYLLLSAVLRRPACWRFRRSPTQWASQPPDTLDTACALRASVSRSVSPGLLNWDSERSTRSGV